MGRLVRRLPDRPMLPATALALVPAITSTAKDLGHMTEGTDLHARVDKAVALLIMAKRILDAWPAQDGKTDSDRLTAEILSQMVGKALEQLAPILGSHLVKTENTELLGQGSAGHTGGCCGRSSASE